MSGGQIGEFSTSPRRESKGPNPWPHRRFRHKGRGWRNKREEEKLGINKGSWSRRRATCPLGVNTEPSDLSLFLSFEGSSESLMKEGRGESKQDICFLSPQKTDSVMIRV